MRVHRSLTVAALTATVAALMALPLAAQMASRAIPPLPNSGVQPTAPVKVPLALLYVVERTCDDRLRGVGEPNTVDMLGATRGVYLDGYGVVFSAEIGLVSPPPIYPFHQTVTPQEKVQIHEKMVQRLPVLRKAMKEMMHAAAGTLNNIPEAQQIVMAVRLDYMKWEDTSGLPGMILMKADRKSALAGIVQTSEE